jgi:hypothetical protein
MTESRPDSVLDSLANQGLAAVPASRFGEVVEECNARADESGDARYPVLGRIFEDVAEWWSEHDERGGIPSALSDQINSAIKQRLPSVLAPQLAKDGYAKALRLAEMLEELLTGPGDWLARGYLKSKGPDAPSD